MTILYTVAEKNTIRWIEVDMGAVWMPSHGEFAKNYKNSIKSVAKIR